MFLSWLIVKSSFKLPVFYFFRGLWFLVWKIELKMVSGWSTAAWGRTRLLAAGKEVMMTLWGAALCSGSENLICWAQEALLCYFSLLLTQASSRLSLGACNNVGLSPSGVTEKYKVTPVLFFCWGFSFQLVFLKDWEKRPTPFGNVTVKKACFHWEHSYIQTSS